MSIVFTLPELGENVAAGEVVRVLVQVGDTLAVDQPVLELETDKATVEVPSAVAGRVTDVKVKAGDTVAVGAPVLVVEGDAAAAAAAPTLAEAPPAPAAPPGASASSPDAVPARGDVESADTPSARPEPVLVEFTLPELGENIASGDVVSVLVKVGARIERDQPALELETDKATVEVPSSVTGVVKEIRVSPGRKVSVGDVVLLVETSAGEGVTPAPIKVSQVRAAVADPAPQLAAGPDKPGMHEDALAEAAAETRPRAPMSPPDARGAGESRGPRAPVPAAPSVRRAARELGVDMSEVKGTGPTGRISIDDVKAHVKKVMLGSGPKVAGAAGPAPVTLPDFTKWGAVERTPMRAVRRKTAEHLSTAWSQIPHVTQFDVADVTVIEDLRQQFGKRAEAAGGKLTVTAVALKVVAAALRAFPQVNTSVDMATGEIVVKKYVHIGVAVDTDRGLLVPVIRDVDRKNIIEISRDLAQLSDNARAGKTTLDEMQGGCFTITNLGGIGGTHFTPIVNYPEVAILGLSRSRMEPVWQGGQFVPRLMLPLSLSYDHRVVDGADGIRFLRWVAEALEQPFLLSLQG